MAGFAGRPCEITHPDGSVTESSFPDAISAHQPFLDIAAMSFPAGEGRAHLEFAGEVFETEDHRNWSDASYKTYCTPITLPFPVEVQPGDSLRQSVRLTLADVPLIPATQVAEPATPGPVIIDVSTERSPLPSLGVHLTDPAWSAAELADLRTLGLSHLHVDLPVGAADAPDRIRVATDRARSLGARLFVALQVDHDASQGVAEALGDAGDTLAGIWAVDPEQKVTTRETTDAWRSRLGADLPWGTGTNLYFTELNRQPPDTTGLDWTTFSVNPQVHSFDDRTVLQNTATLEVIAQEAPRLAGRTRVHVGPVSLRPRFNPNATDPASDVSSTDLPADVDARQRTWFAAAWAALALGSISTPGTVAAVTLFEDLGWKGLRARDSGAEIPAFPSLPGETFPVADVLRAVRGATSVVPTVSSDPECVDALIVEGESGLRAIIANLTDGAREVRLAGAVSERLEVPPHTIAFIDPPRRTT